MVLLLLEFLFHISRQQNAVSLYTVLVLLRIWRLLIIPAFGEILRQWYAKVSARPSLSSTHYGLQRQCSARVTRRSASVEKPPQGRHFHLAGIIWLINVGEAATEESTAAAAAGQTPGKTVAIAADASTSTDFPYGQSGTGRLSFRLRRLQRNAKHPAIYDSLRSVEEKAVSRLRPLSPENCGHSAAFRIAPSSYAPDRNFLLLKSRDSTLLSPTAPKGPKSTPLTSVRFAVTTHESAS